MKFAMITTCMGRAEHLGVSLPLMLDQDYVEPVSFCKDSEVVVVDWDSKDDLHAVIRSQPVTDNLYCTRVDGKQYFHLSAARNAGAQYAIDHLDPEWLVFVDADILLPPDFLSTNACLLEGWVSEQGFLHTQKTDDGDVQMWGSCIVRATDWQRVHGYDEGIVGYGFEDNDFYERLQVMGLTHHPMHVQGVTTIEHSEELRFANYPEEFVDDQDYGRDRC